MADSGGVSTAGKLRRTIKKRWRSWLRAIHRDVGYLLVGLTFVYAISGVAVNHIDDWNANYEPTEKTYTLDVAVPPVPIDEDGIEDQAALAAATRAVLDQAGIDDEPVSAYMATDTQLEIELPDNNHVLHADLATGKVFEEYEEPRFFIRVANWLHVQRGKPAWNYIADSYAILLLYLATSGLFMLKGRKGLVGRGAILVAIGIAVPILYVHWSGGP